MSVTAPSSLLPRHNLPCHFSLVTAPPSQLPRHFSPVTSPPSQLPTTRQTSITAAVTPRNGLSLTDFLMRVSGFLDTISCYLFFFFLKILCVYMPLMRLCLLVLSACCLSLGLSIVFRGLD